MQTGEVQDLRFQRREWRIQRVGWLLMFGFVVAGLLGVFGPGPLSLSTAESADRSVVVEYYRFARMGGPGTVTVTVGPDLVRDGTVDVWWNAAYLDEMRIEDVAPEPESVTAVGDRVKFGFAAESGGAPLDFTFDLTPDGMWSKRAEIAVADDRAQLTFDQFIYP